MKDEYENALSILREEAAEPSDGGERTRLRVLASLHERSRTARHGSRVWFAMAACLATSIAFAHYVSSAREHDAKSATRTRPTVRIASAGPSPQLPVTPDVPVSRAAPATPATDTSSARQSTTLPLKARRTHARVPAPNAPLGPDAGPVAVAETPKPSPRSSEAQQQALYLAAHRLQFRGAPATALAAWDAYLATAPEGSLVAEARYNRAVILVRLGRIAEAREALAPFARGQFAGFRQADAKRFLATLPETNALSASER